MIFKKLFQLMFLLIIFLNFSNLLLAKSKAESKILNEKILVGDNIKYKIIIPNPEKNVISLNSMDLSPFDLIKKSQLTTKDNKVEFLLELSIYEIGKQTIPELKFIISGEKNETELVIPSKELVVGSVLNKADEKGLAIKDIKDSILIKEKSYFIIYLLLGVLSFIILFFVFKKWSEKEKSTPVIIEEKIPADEIAYKKLSELINQDLIKKGKVKEYFFLLSEIVREFIGNRYDFDSIELTSGELVSAIKTEAKFNREYLVVINNFLEDSDLIKFSKIEPLSEEIENTTKLAFKIVDDLKIKIMDWLW